ncbi:gliding motility-associated C-terminal domain-containing protein [Flagellimonas sp.]|uniref:T9SS type B sorting domain-containing protein n=1 Tax=Flagellimonas sp. TaxID=2058762 RepID=UPI003BADB88C
MTKNEFAQSGRRALGATFFLFLAFSFYAHSQCAGTDNTVTVCNKFDDISNQGFDLFANLGGNPQPGGVWSTPDPTNLNALSTATGILNLWQVNYFGEHQFTYFNEACNESATITLFLGGYSGEDNIDGSANACSDDPAVNLFTYLGSDVDLVIPDFNGVWAEDPNTETGHLAGNLFDAEAAGPGEYIFTYTVPAVDGCFGMQSTVNLEVHKAPYSGIPSSLVVCNTDDLSGLTNFDLNSLLADEDANGVWSEDGTNQIDGILDRFVNVEEIRNNNGYGAYTFTYTVQPSHPVCPPSSSDVYIIILPALNGSLESLNYCLGDSYEVTLNYDTNLLPPGQYQIDYSVYSSEGNQEEFTGITLQNGTGTFNVPSSLVPLNETVQLSIIGIEGTSPEQVVCGDIDVTSTEFLVSNPIASGENICPDNTVTIDMENILDADGNPTNEMHTINYTLILPDDTSLNFQEENLAFSNGSASFQIDAEQFQLSGSYTVEITVQDSFEIDCTIGTQIQVLPIPEEIELDIAVDNNCDATSIDVLVDAPNLPNGNYTITYEVVEQNTQTSLTENSINFMGGVAVYGIDIANLPDGDYIVILKSTQNDTTPCRLQFEFELQESFSIGGTPTVINLESNQSFCLNDGIPTLADITVDTSGNVTFYDTLEDDTPLPLSTVLIDGEDYFVFSENENDNCSPNERARVTVSLVQASTPVSENITPLFCGSENPMLMDLEVTSTNNGNIIWYDTVSGGTPLDPTEQLMDGQSYFAAEFLFGFCESETRLEFIPTIVNPPLPNLSAVELGLCALDNPTVQELINLVVSMDGVEVTWFLDEVGGEPLSGSELLLADTIYYARSKDIETGCGNLESVPVTVDLNNCDPEKYGFFIPDAFSPNSDGRNDTYYIPNISIIFPNFTLEIFNRYGNSLFKGDASNPAWDGTGPGGKTVPNGVYFYIINFNREGYEPKQGRLYLNR